MGTVTGTLTVTLLSFTDTTAEPAATPLTVTTLLLTDTVAIPPFDELAETVPEYPLAVSFPVAPTASDSEAGDTVMDLVTVTGRLMLGVFASRT